MKQNKIWEVKYQIWETYWIHRVLSRKKMWCIHCWKIKNLQPLLNNCYCQIRVHKVWMVKNNREMIKRNKWTYTVKCLKCWHEAKCNWIWWEKNCAKCSLPKTYKLWEIVEWRMVTWRNNTWYKMKCPICTKVSYMTLRMQCWCSCQIKVNRLKNENNKRPSRVVLQELWES